MMDHADLISRLKTIVGPAHVLHEHADMDGFLREPRDLFKGHAQCVVRPASTAEVAAIVRLCHETRTAIVPQGGNTGLVGGQIPSASGHEIILSLTRMTKLRSCDPASNVMIVEAGMSLHNVQDIAAAHDRLFPLSLASEGSCTIGGNLATNAGGTAVLAYGNTRDLVMGVEVVLADGRIMSQLSTLKKDNTGYDLKNLFIGSEGTLGIITAASLKLFPKPRSIETAFVGVASPQKALDFLLFAQANVGEDIKTFEIIPRIGVDFVTRHMAARDPLNTPHEWYVLLELTSSAAQGLNAKMTGLLEEALERDIIDDASIAASLEQRHQFWNVREWLSEVQKYEGGSIKHDVSVPVHAVPAFLQDVIEAIEQLIPSARPVPFGHLGDGNIHCNITQPIGADKAAFLARWDDVNELVHGLVMKYKGSISAEHGIGTLKRDLLPRVKDPVALDVMRAIKHALDPHNLMNPNKVLPSK
jgi:FAD/FMN-containing dehydrogenase